MAVCCSFTSLSFCTFSDFCNVKCFTCAENYLLFKILDNQRTCEMVKCVDVFKFWFIVVSYHKGLNLPESKNQSKTSQYNFISIPKEI